MSRSEDNPSEANEAGRPIIVDSQGNAESSETAAPKKAKQPKTSEYAGTHMSESKNLPQNQPAPVIIKQSGSRGLAVGALVLALLGLGASGFLFVQGQNVLKNQELSFNQKLDKAALGESEKRFTPERPFKPPNRHPSRNRPLGQSANGKQRTNPVDAKSVSRADQRARQLVG